MLYEVITIAKHLGMQPETLSRSLARLRGQGIVAEGNTVRISDVTVLRRLGRQESSPDKSAGFWKF